MALPDLFILRHGETAWNREGRMQGGLDSPLTDLGRQQAVGMGDVLRSLEVTADSHRVISSPQGRAMHTAELLGLAAPEPVDDLREIHMGDWIGLSRAEIDSRWPSADPEEDFVDFYARVPNGESFPALWDRVGQVLAMLDRPTVIVTHGFTSRFLRTRALGLPMYAVREVPGGQGVVFRIKDGEHLVFGSEIFGV